MPESVWPDRDAYEPGSYKNEDAWLDDLLDAADHRPLPFEVDD